MNTYTLLAILHVWAATPQHYGAFEIAVSPGYNETECALKNHEANQAGRNEVCDSDERIAEFVNAHGCEAIPAFTLGGTIRFVCTR